MPAERVDQTLGDGHSMPSIGDLVQTDQCFTGDDGKAMVMAFCEDEELGLRWVADLYETELEPLRT